MRTMTLLLLTAALLAGAGCERGFDTPDGFVLVEPDHSLFTQRAVSADGVTIALRVESNPDDGTLAFWAEAIHNELVDRRGYVLDKRETVTSATGLVGELMSFSAKQELTDMRYMLVVFVDGADVLVGEAGGRAEDVDPQADAIRAALLTVK